MAVIFNSTKWIPCEIKVFYSLLMTCKFINVRDKCAHCCVIALSNNVTDVNKVRTVYHTIDTSPKEVLVTPNKTWPSQHCHQGQFHPSADHAFANKQQQTSLVQLVRAMVRDRTPIDADRCVCVRMTFTHHWCTNCRWPVLAKYRNTGRNVETQQIILIIDGKTN